MNTQVVRVEKVLKKIGVIIHNGGGFFSLCHFPSARVGQRLRIIKDERGRIKNVEEVNI